MQKSPCELLVGQVDTLQKRYEDEYLVSSDIKALQGVERCIELKMKLWGLDGKGLAVGVAAEAKYETESTLDLGKLSKEALSEILAQMS